MAAVTPRAQGFGMGTVSGLVGGVVAAAAFIAPHEGWKNKTYTDAAGYVTVCAGNRSAAIPDMEFSDEECSLLLFSDVVVHVIAVSKLVKVPIDDDMWVALTSFSFNLGWQALRKSTLLRKVNEGDRDGAAAEFGKWVLAGGKPLRGLIVRRAREARLFMSNNDLG
jgi:lysozyme